MAIITKLVRAKKMRCTTRSFRTTLRWMKKHAHRAYRRAAKRAVRAGEDVNESPRLTG